MTTRRDFLKGVAALAVIPAVPGMVEAMAPKVEAVAGKGMTLEEWIYAHHGEALARWESANCLSGPGALYATLALDTRHIPYRRSRP